MPTFSERIAAWRKAMAQRAAERTWSQLLSRSREALDAATAPLRDFAEAERQRLEAIRRRLAAGAASPAESASDGDESGGPR